MVRLTILVVAAAMGVAAGDAATPSIAPVEIPAVSLAPAVTALPVTVEVPDTPTVAPLGGVTAPPLVVSDKESETSTAKKAGSDSADNSVLGAATKQTPMERLENYIFQVVIVLIFAAIYKTKVVDQYPEVQKPNEKSIQLQGENEFSAMFSGCCSTNFLLSWCCLAPRAAHTFDKTETLGYWPGVVLMLIAPVCTLTYTNACTDMNEKLGGEKRNIIMSCLCAWCCTCCVVLQDAESLDAATGAKTQCCGVDTDDVEGGSSSAGE